MLKSSGGKLSIPLIVSTELEHLRQKIIELETKIKEKEKTITMVNEKLSKVKHRLTEALKELE